MPDLKLPTVCGHAGTKIVQYSSHGAEIIHTICSSCYSKGIYFVQEAINPDELIPIDGGSAYVEIELSQWHLKGGSSIVFTNTEEEFIGLS